MTSGSILFDQLMGGNVTTAIGGVYTTPMGFVFYAVIWFALAVTLYIKLENADIVLMMSAIYGATGLMLLPTAAQPLMLLILGVGLAGLLYRAFNGWDY